jgi:hypothetical protein
LRPRSARGSGSGRAERNTVLGTKSGHNGIRSYIAIMIKTQVQLEKWQYQAAKSESARTSRSLSDLVREGLAAVLRKSALRPRQSLEELAGKYEPRSTEDLKAHDRAWADSIR